MKLDSRNVPFLLVCIVLFACAETGETRAPSGVHDTVIVIEGKENVPEDCVRLRQLRASDGRLGDNPVYGSNEVALAKLKKMVYDLGGDLVLLQPDYSLPTYTTHVVEGKEVWQAGVGFRCNR